MQEKAVVQGVSGPALVQYILPESDLSMDASGTETLNNIRDLFETAIQPEDREQLAALFRLATELAEVLNLLDRIEQTPEGKDLSESPTG